MANITLDKLKTIVQSIVASVTRYKPNLSVNDPDDPRYVAGRLCYKTDPVEKTLADKEIIETAERYTESVWSFLLKEGQSYTVVWDGVTYTDVCSEYDGGYGVGNAYLYSDNAKNTGEPFYLETFDGATGVYVAETGSHTVTIVTVEPGKIITLPKEYLPQIPAEKLPDLDLAAVATSGSYNDLTDRPAIPSDVLKYTAQGLTTAQKEQARTNIGAGTSSFDGAYSSLTGAPVLAAVATSGSYNDLTGTPTAATYNADDAYLYDGSGMQSYKAEALYNYLTVGAKVYYFASDVIELATVKEYTPLSGDYYKYIGNLNLQNTSMPDTGEDWLVYAIDNASDIYFGMGHRKTEGSALSEKFTIVKSESVTFRKIDDVFIPSSIQRVGEPLYLTDSAGAKWQLVVGTDGTLTTTAVTE